MRASKKPIKLDLIPKDRPNYETMLFDFLITMGNMLLRQ